MITPRPPCRHDATDAAFADTPMLRHFHFTPFSMISLRQAAIRYCRQPASIPRHFSHFTIRFSPPFRRQPPLIDTPAFSCAFRFLMLSVPPWRCRQRSPPTPPLISPPLFTPHFFDIFSPDADFLLLSCRLRFSPFFFCSAADGLLFDILLYCHAIFAAMLPRDARRLLIFGHAATPCLSPFSRCRRPPLHYFVTPLPISLLMPLMPLCRGHCQLLRLISEAFCRRRFAAIAAIDAFAAFAAIDAMIRCLSAADIISPIAYFRRFFHYFHYSLFSAFRYAASYFGAPLLPAAADTLPLDFATIISLTPAAMPPPPRRRYFRRSLPPRLRHVHARYAVFRRPPRHAKRRHATPRATIFSR